jgi:hypothetical protein
MIRESESRVARAKAECNGERSQVAGGDKTRWRLTSIFSRIRLTCGKCPIQLSGVWSEIAVLESS